MIDKEKVLNENSSFMQGLVKTVSDNYKKDTNNMFLEYRLTFGNGKALTAWSFLYTKIEECCKEYGVECYRISRGKFWELACTITEDNQLLVFLNLKI